MVRDREVESPNLSAPTMIVNRRFLVVMLYLSVIFIIITCPSLGAHVGNWVAQQEQDLGILTQDIADRYYWTGLITGAIIAVILSTALASLAEILLYLEKVNSHDNKKP